MQVSRVSLIFDAILSSYVILSPSACPLVFMLCCIRLFFNLLCTSFPVLFCLPELIYIRKELNCVKRDREPTFYQQFITMLVIRSSSVGAMPQTWWHSSLTKETSQLGIIVYRLVV